MPIIDVSQKSYRSLVKAAHKRGMSIDRFIQHVFENDSPVHESEHSANTPSQTNNVAAPVSIDTAPTPLRPHRAILAVSAAPDPDRDSNLAFSALWDRIEASAGKAISTKRGQCFTYEVDSGYLTVTESGARIPRSQFKKALSQWPQNGPSNIRGIYAASVVWAVLADERILNVAA
jgi:hypothetical protein